ncbi:hypothetical protein Hanom_Chr14g01294231 [Helianthus anomalus]
MADHAGGPLEMQQADIHRCGHMGCSRRLNQLRSRDLSPSFFVSLSPPRNHLIPPRSHTFPYKYSYPRKKVPTQPC